jgi:hypothetical protein
VTLSPKMARWALKPMVFTFAMLSPATLSA